MTLPARVQRRLEEASAPLRAVARGVSWVNAGNYHLTLKFLGAVEEGRAREVAAALGQAMAGIRAFEVALRGLGAFPTATCARVVWAGVGAGAPSLVALAGAVEQALEPLGFAREGRPYSPHVTLGRAREPRRDLALAEALARAGDLDLEATRVEAVALMRSELSPRGARYSELAALPLSPSL